MGDLALSNVFRVDAAGNVYGTSFRSPGGDPIPNGDITGVAAGTGLSGGGSSGDVSVALDTTFTDARYAALSHGHTVGEIAGAATLGSNTFTGNQSVVGNMTATQF